ncbi:MAG TPA: hypothetical protein VHT31_04600, partial [Candidatus Acidoferrum sp.]|nr:hypothetical protein [Candidatus Acidoferrum sp.]
GIQETQSQDSHVEGKAQRQCVRTLAVSLANDADAKALAESYGAVLLLDMRSAIRKTLEEEPRVHPPK